MISSLLGLTFQWGISDKKLNNYIISIISEWLLEVKRGAVLRRTTSEPIFDLRNRKGLSLGGKRNIKTKGPITAKNSQGIIWEKNVWRDRSWFKSTNAVWASVSFVYKKEIEFDNLYCQCPALTLCGLWIRFFHFMTFLRTPPSSLAPLAKIHKTRRGSRTSLFLKE